MRARYFTVSLIWALPLTFCCFVVARCTLRLSGLSPTFATAASATLAGGTAFAAIVWWRSLRTSVDRPELWPVSPIAIAHMHRSDRWWMAYSLIAVCLLVAVFGYAIPFALFRGVGDFELLLAASMAPAAFVLCLVPPIERRRVLRRRRTARRCLRCTYPLTRGSGRICPECGHVNDWYAA